MEKQPKGTHDKDGDRNRDRNRDRGNDDHKIHDHLVEILSYQKQILKQLEIMAKQIEDLEAKIDTLQQTVDTEQQEMADTIAALQAENQALKDAVAAGGTPEDFLRISEKVDTILADVASTITLPTPDPEAVARKRKK